MSERNVMWDFGNARVVTLRVNPIGTDDVLVERKLANGEWERATSYNSLSDDYAFTNARDCAQRLSRRAP